MENMQPRRPGNRRSLDTVTRLLCVIALLLAGFTHRIPAPSPQPDVDLSAYAMPDGTLPVICYTPSDTGDGGGTAVFFSDCESCRLAAVAILPTPNNAAAPPCAAAAVPFRVAHDLTDFPIHFAGTPTRGPPLA